VSVTHEADAAKSLGRRLIHMSIITLPYSTLLGTPYYLCSHTQHSVATHSSSFFLPSRKCRVPRPKGASTLFSLPGSNLRQNPSTAPPFPPLTLWSKTSAILSIFTPCAASTLGTQSGYTGPSEYPLPSPRNAPYAPGSREDSEMPL
jgi:hypothetical protein